MVEDFNEKPGLSRSNRGLITTIVFIILLLWGPIEPYGQVVRTIYLVAIPVLLWLVLGYFGSKWKAGELENDRLSRGIAGIIAGVFFVGAYLTATAAYHSECTKEVRTTDGGECVGDYVPVKGPDKFDVLVLVGLGIASAWYAITEHKQES